MDMSIVISLFPMQLAIQALNFNVSGNPQPHGFIKVVSDAESGKVLGVHMVGPRVTELLAEAVTALGFEADLETWSEVIHPHPSLSEAMAEAVAAAAGKPVHGG